MLLLRVRHIAWKRMSVEKTLIKQDRFTQNQKKKKYGFVISSQETYPIRPISLLRWACGSLSPLKSSKTNRRFKRTKFAQEIRKGPKMKKKTIGVTVTYLTYLPYLPLNCLPWQSWPESRQSASVTWRAFSIPGSSVGKQGDLRGEGEI